MSPRRRYASRAAAAAAAHTHARTSLPCHNLTLSHLSPHSPQVTLACTSPKVDAEGVRLASPDPTLSLSIFNRLNPKNSLACSIERTPKSIHLTAGGSREVAPGAKLRGKWGTTGILAMALELSGDKSQLTFATEVNSIGPLNPKFGLNLNLSLDATGGSGPQSELDKQAELAGRLE